MRACLWVRDSPGYRGTVEISAYQFCCLAPTQVGGELGDPTPRMSREQPAEAAEENVPAGGARLPARAAARPPAKVTVCKVAGGGRHALAGSLPGTVQVT